MVWSWDNARRIITSIGYWGAIALCVVGTASCGSKGPVYIEDHRWFLRIDAAIDGLRRAYVEHDLSGFRDHLLPSDKVDRLDREVEADLRTFQHITLDMTVERIMIEKEAIDVYVHWQGQWKREPADAPLRERGHGRLQFVGNKIVLLEAADGNLPFGMSGRSLTQPPSPPAPGS